MPHICYIDESGDINGLHSPGRLLEGQPVYVVLGLIISEKSLEQITPEFLKIRDDFAPGEIEAKGSELRGDLKKTSNGSSSHAGLVALKSTLKLLDGAGVNARVTGRVFVKQAGQPFKGENADKRALRFIAENFSRFLRTKNMEGRVVFDSRSPKPDSKNNKRAARAMLLSSGQPWPKLQWPPVFARSEDRIGLQMADWLCSALVAPLAATAYCGDCMQLRESIHVNKNYLKIRDQHGGGEWLWRRQLRLQKGGRLTWGLAVDDPCGRSSEFLFRAPAGN